MYCLTREAWEMGVLVDATYQEAALTNDSDKFWIKVYEALAPKADQFNSAMNTMG